jgi:hypothetical protein
MTLTAVIRHLENRARAARHMAAAHELNENPAAAAASAAAAVWFDEQATDLANNR